MDIGVDTFGASDLALDYNTSTDNRAFRINIHSDQLENHRDFYDGDRTGFNPTLRVELSENTTLDLSYEYADHERMIDRGIPRPGYKIAHNKTNIGSVTSGTFSPSLETFLIS